MYNLKLRSYFTAWLLVCSIITNNRAVAQKPVAANGIFYAISGHGIKDTSYLFGTYHLMKDGYLNDKPAVKQRFDKAKGVVVEVVIDSATMAEENKKMFMKDDSLSALLDKGFYDTLNTELMQTLGVGLDKVNKLKPVAISTTLALVYAMKDNAELLNKYAGAPLDMFFASTAKQLGKNITPLETIELQMELLFNKPTIPKQVDGMKMFMRNKNTMVALGDSLVTAYVNNNLNAMYSIYAKTLEESHEEDYLIKDRNAEWMKKLPGLLSSGAQFIAVGALHLAGPYGIVEQLKQNGYTVTPIKI